MNLKTAFQDNERAVSPVIGVILMVAITVILAAVIGTFVLGLGDSIESEVNAGVTINGTDDSTSRTVTYTAQGTSTDLEVRGGDITDGISLETVGNSTTINSGGSYSAVAINEENGRETVVRTFEVADSS
ncbi:type IV pilin [Halorubrum rutilum]|uniref:Type IV pilin n=1 Tax=Halorubrum rutilum TaxID=1364933 RepID=A0ABD6APK1_9EURY|nr:type IV pilin N-terminal domain-containing protein [Halorubrum rutilum]